MDIEDLQAELEELFNPGLDEDGLPEMMGDFPNPRLENEHGLDLSYLTLIREGSSIHPHTRFNTTDEPLIPPLFRNSDVPFSLFTAGLRLFGDSILAYHGQTKRSGYLHYHPPVILTFWSGFETFVRYTSELMLFTVRNVPPVVASFLREEVISFNRNKSDFSTRIQYQSVLDRYVVLLRYGYGYRVNRVLSQIA